MKKNKTIGIVFFVLLILVTVIPLVIPKSYSEIIKINNSEITEINSNLEGKVYKYGTPITAYSDYRIYYIDWWGDDLASYRYYKDSSDGVTPYIGITDGTINLEKKSPYWKIVQFHAISANEYEIILRPVATNNNFYSDCDLETITIGDTCKVNDYIYTSNYAGIIYKDENGQEIGQSYDIIPGDNYYSIGRSQAFGYNRDESLEDVSLVWRLVDAEYSSVNIFTFVPTEITQVEDVEFNLVCDKNSINYQENTICHFNVKNFMITEDPIILELKGKDDLEIIKITPNRYFNVSNNNNTITINSNYLSTFPEDIELFTVEVKAKKPQNQDNNIEISNIKYYGTEQYRDIQTTIQIRSNVNNPLTKRQTTILLIVLIAVSLVTVSSILLKKKSV